MNQDEVLNSFVNKYFKDKIYIKHCDIDNLCLNFKIIGIHNYFNLLNEESLKIINENFSSNFKYFDEIKNKKKTELMNIKENLKKNHQVYLNSENKKKNLLFFNFPEFELFFVAKLIVNEMEIKPEFTSKILFNSKNMNQNISLIYQYNDLTLDSKIIIEIYLMQLPKEKSLIGRTTINLFDSNFNLEQGRHIFKIQPVLKNEINQEKNNNINNNNIINDNNNNENNNIINDNNDNNIIINDNNNNENNNNNDNNDNNNDNNDNNNINNDNNINENENENCYDEDNKIDKILDDLVHNYNTKFKDENKTYETSISILENENILVDDLINSYYFLDNEPDIIYLKDEYMRNYETKLQSLLSTTQNTYIEIEFPLFNKRPVIFQEKKSQDYKKSFKSTNLNMNKNKQTSLEEIYLQNFICDPTITKEKNIENLFNNPITEKFFTLLQTINSDLNPEEMKLNNYDRTKINKILNKPDFISLDQNSLILFWKYRFELLKNDEPYALTKILNSVQWGNPKIEIDFINTILYKWKTVEMGDILYMLSRKFSVNNLYVQEITDKKTIINNLNGLKLVRKFAISKLGKLDDKNINFILLQLVQALKYEDIEENPLANFLIEKCSKNIELATSLYWFLKVEKDNSDQKGKKDKEEPKIITIYKEIFNKFVEKIKDNNDIYTNIQKQEEFHDNLLNISNALQKYKKAEQKKIHVREILNNQSDGLGKEMIKHFPLPLYPHSEVCGTIPEKCTVFASAKCPVKYDFKITPETMEYLKKDKDDKDDHSFYSVIFKNGDDIRQDQLILQIISFMDSLLRDVELNFQFTTYKVLATSKESGFVEFVNNSDTIFNILKKDKKIQQYIKKHSNDSNYQEHLKNYLISCAGYCVVTYLLAIGDRHLENLMIDQKGRLFHIDFGYILGKDPKPYPPPIKLCSEMVECIDDKEEFKNLCVKCFLILRQNSRLIVNMFYLMKDSGISEVNNIENLNKLYNRFESEYTTQQATNALMSKIDDSISAIAAVFFEKLHSWAVYWK